jgi:hypothetical protein
MSEIEAKQFKFIMKDAFIEVINSNKELIYDVFYEAVEDFYLLQAIQEGELSGTATKEAVFAILEA